MPNLLGPDGRPVSSGYTIAAAQSRQEKDLTLRSAEILRSITLWEMTRRLSPMLVCKHCFEACHKDYAKRQVWTVEIASTAFGSILAQCACTSWVCKEPVPLDTSDIPRESYLVETLGRKKRPIGAKEFRLLEAWRQVMLDHHWFETLSCMDCAKHTLDSFCTCAVIPGKSASVNCACTERTYVGITK